MPEVKFEEALRKLETVVEELESGELPLEQALKKYEEGVKHAQVCAKKLDAAQRKVEQLIKQQDGSFTTELFDESKASQDDSN